MSASTEPSGSATPGRRPKAIVVFSDGTGNSSAKVFKTNVWRLYQAVDTTDVDPAEHEGVLRQVVAYDDGVGTSSFKPLALLGGAFGVGLMRNVLELYRFVCLNYEKGDRIYAFGFSRGAFTIRVLVGLLTSVGIIDRKRRDPDLAGLADGPSATISHADLKALSEDAYRQFRRHFVLSGDRTSSASTTDHRGLTRLIVDPLRNFRDRRIARRRAKSGPPILTGSDLIEVDEIAFVGVWDTVAAYGSPIAEVTKGIDRWVWPLSMPDYKLSEKVACARHALALDDERDTFHPLLWDEVHERDLVAAGRVRPQRLRQVWFAGMHSDVGGGYSDDSLAYVSLLWMAQEAMSAGLRLKPDELEQFRDNVNPFGPLHDSRSGVAAYYRYQPRKIAARLEHPDPHSRVFQDPDFNGKGMLTGVHLHDSVLRRIEHGGDGYAPIVLPPDYDVEGGPVRERFSRERAQAQEKVWDRVWRRRVNYFLTLAFTFALLVIGALGPSPASCIGPQCVLTPVIRWAGGWLPSFTSQWVEAYADRPGTFLVLAIAVLWLLRSTARTELELRDLMRKLLVSSIGSPAGAPPELLTRAAKLTKIRKFRTHGAYQKILRYVKWRASPGLAAAAIYVLCLLLGAAAVTAAVTSAHRVQLTFSAQRLCERNPERDAATFDTSNICWRIPDGDVTKGERYRLTLVVDAWHDADISASPAGFSTDRFKWWFRPLAPLLRRSLNDPWFQPILHVADYRFGDAAFVSVPMKVVEYDGGKYVGEFVAPRSGPLMLAVNDAVWMWFVDPELFYTGKDGRNEGKASVVTVDACGAKTIAPPCTY
ncbi:MAG TPA: DUF2235 domain-containing protein [Gammaproteobacteria bacterium]|nr:DUF2235 domain-containing protein [Gammaproteobacteria bacterium]